MEDSCNKKIIKKLYENMRYKEITDLLSLVIKIEKEINEPVINKFFIQNIKVFSLNAIYWNKNNPQNYTRIFSSIRIEGEKDNEFDIRKIKKKLVLNIYKTVIKKEIMMI